MEMEIARAAKAIKEAKSILITAGAGNKACVLSWSETWFALVYISFLAF